jgi:O-acetyl-ADP-ribose deacetylase (regulator of RNase III)
MTAPASPLPSIHLLCMDDKFIDAFNSAKGIFRLPSSINITFHNVRLSELDSSVQFDAIVSPANSYARLDGGFDDALSRAFSPQGDYLALTRVAQAVVYKEWRGFAPPGSCTLVDLDRDDVTLKKNEWGCRYLALCPTMKIPQNVVWDREVVYDCVWALLTAIDKHNSKARDSNFTEDREIRTFLMTPLATGFGGWSGERWAAQTVLAIRHFVDALENAERWATMGPIRIMQHCDEVEKTYAL